MFYHASLVKDIKLLEPRISNHGIPLIYFSEKRENVLVYLSNAIEKFCNETGFHHTGIWHKWASYGFDKDGILTLEEYYPNALIETYKGVSGYIYVAECINNASYAINVPFLWLQESLLRFRVVNLSKTLTKKLSKQKQVDLSK